MLRKSREVTDHGDIMDIVRRSLTLRVGFYGEEYPYVVPVSFGFDISGEKPVFYFHGAKIGYKLSLLEKNDRVCAESDIFRRVTPTARGITALYESFIAFGRAASSRRERKGSGGSASSPGITAGAAIPQTGAGASRAPASSGSTRTASRESGIRSRTARPFPEIRNG